MAPVALCGLAKLSHLPRYQCKNSGLKMCRGLNTGVRVGQSSVYSVGGVKSKVMDVMKWYEEVIGVHEVRLAQKKVLDAKEKFVQIQEERREASRAVAEVQNRLKEIHSELDATSRGEDRYVRLITEENKILKEEKQLVYHFQQIERQERDYFSILSTAVTESHEKEREQAEKVKYWSIIGSVAGTIIGIMGSSINNYFKMAEMRKLLKETVELNNSSSLPAVLSKHEKELSSIVNEMKLLTNSQQGVGSYLSEKLYNVTNKLLPQSGTESVGEITSLLKRQSDRTEQLFHQLSSQISRNPQDVNRALIDSVNKQNSVTQQKLDNIYSALHTLAKKSSQTNIPNYQPGGGTSVADQPDVGTYVLVGSCAFLAFFILAKICGA